MSDLKRKLELIDELSSKRLKIETETTKNINDEIEELRKIIENTVKESQELKEMISKKDIEIMQIQELVKQNQELKAINLKNENKLKEYNELEEIINFDKLKEMKIKNDILIKENKELEKYKKINNNYIEKFQVKNKEIDEYQKTIHSLKSMINTYNNEYDIMYKHGETKYPIEYYSSTYNQYKSGYYRWLIVDNKLHEKYVKFKKDFDKIEKKL